MTVAWDEKHGHEGDRGRSQSSHRRRRNKGSRSRSRGDVAPVASCIRGSVMTYELCALCAQIILLLLWIVIFCICVLSTSSNHVLGTAVIDGQAVNVGGSKVLTDGVNAGAQP